MSRKRASSITHDLHAACQQGILETIIKLIDDPSVKEIINTGVGVLGYTPLHEAASRRNHPILEVLLQHNANVNATSNGGYTPLHIAASIGSEQCIEVLLKFNADVNLKDEFGKTPHETAMLNRRKTAARLLKTAEVKYAVENNAKNFGKIIEPLVCGSDVIETCFDECLELSVKTNRHFAAGFLILRSPQNIIKCLQLAIRLPNSTEVAAMLLLCVAVRCSDYQLVELLFQKDDDLLDPKILDCYSLKYVQQKFLNINKIRQLKRAMRTIDHAFPITLACSTSNPKAAKILLFNMYCDFSKFEADWNSLAITSMQEDWIVDISKFERLLLGWNVITQLPTNICVMNNLLRLDLQHNNMSVVPGCLFELPFLRNLNLSYNNLKELPVINRWSSSLNVLNVAGNSLHTFPSNMTGATIEYLNMSSNKLTKIPSGVCHLTTLVSLDISENKEIRDFPIELGRLTKLISLNFKGLQIHDPPPIHQKNTQTLIHVLRSRLRSSVTYNTMKLLLIGQASHGKTTLMHRLKGLDRFRDDISTQGIDIQEMYLNKRTSMNSFPTYTFRVWDFAGQEEYYATHQCFLSERALYLLVWDLTDGKKGVWGLKNWLDNLSARLTYPYVVIVGTKLDLVQCENLDAYEKEMFDALKELINCEPTYEHINFELILNVSSNVQFKDYRKRMEKLKSSIYDVASRMTDTGLPGGHKVMGEQVPYIYQLLEKELLEQRKLKLRKQQIPVLTRDEYIDVIRNIKSSKDTFEDDDFEIATKFLHNIGSILHYNDPNQDLKDLYFISPSWICRLMSKVITINAAHNFIPEGILHVNDIRHIMGERNEEFPPRFYEKYMRLLNRFQICCQIDDHRVLVPSKLPNRKRDVINRKSDFTDMLSRIHYFPCIPYGFWSRFISRLLMLLPEMISENFTFEMPDESDTSSQCSLDEEIDTKSDISDGHGDFLESMQFDGVGIAGINMNRSASVVVNNDLSLRSYAGQSKLSSPYTSDGSNNFLVRTTTQKISDVSSTPEVSENESGFDGHFKSVDSAYNDSESDYSSESNYNVIKINSQLTPVASTYKKSEACPVSIERVESRTFSDDKSQSTVLQKCMDLSLTTISDDVFDILNVILDKVSFLTDSEHLNDKDINNNKKNGIKFSSNARVFERQSLSFDETITSNEAYDSEVFESGNKFNELKAQSEKTSLKFTNIGTLMDHKILTCWKTGIIFNHPKLYFSVQEKGSSIADRKAIETMISNSPLGWRVLGFILDDIRTVIDEWYPGLSGSDGHDPYVLQHIACPVCMKMGIRPPHYFDILTLFLRLYKSNGSMSIACMKSHYPRIVDISDICPEFVFKDLPSSLQINLDKLYYKNQSDHMIGFGAFGKVYRGKYYGTDAAVKEYNFNTDSDEFLQTSLDDFFNIRQEIFILSKLQSNPFIVEFLGFSTHPKLCAIMERACHGTLKDALRDKNHVIERILMYRIAQQIASGLSFIHSRNIIHRDIKSDNVLLFSLDQQVPLNVKITDFGTALFTSPSGLNDVIGTPGFIAPEMYDFCSSDEYTAKVDVYSFAMVLCEMITNRTPFHDMSNGPRITAAVKNGDRPKFNDIPVSYYGLLTMTELTMKMWRQECTERPEAKEVLQQLNTKSFQLLYGKRVLQMQNPRFFCFVPEENELWIVCDDVKGRNITIVDMDTSLVKYTIKVDGDEYGISNFNFANICLIDSNQIILVLRGTHDVILTFSVVHRRVINSFSFEEEHVTAIYASTNYVFLGYGSGVFTRILKKNFSKKKLKNFTIDIDTHLQRPISFIISNSDNLIVACDNSLFRYYLDFPNSGRTKVKLKRISTQPIENIVLSFDERFLYIFFQCSSVVLCYICETLKEVGSCDIEDIVNEMLPTADPIDKRVSCVCSVYDVLWIGTGSGSILIYHVIKDITTSKVNFELLIEFHPYAMETRNFCLIEVEQPRTENERYLIASTGRSVDTDIFGAGSLCKLDDSYPDDNVSQARRYSADILSLESRGKRKKQQKYVLIWHALDAKSIKNMKSY